MKRSIIAAGVLSPATSVSRHQVGQRFDAVHAIEVLGAGAAVDERLMTPHRPETESYVL